MLFASRDVGEAMIAVATAGLLWATLDPGLKKVTRDRAYAAAVLLAALIACGAEGITVLVTLMVSAWLSHPRPTSLLKEGGKMLASPVGKGATAVFMGSMLLIGTNFGSNPQGLQWAAVDGWATWARSFSLSVPRGTVVLLLLLYEWPVVLLGLLQLFRTVVRRDRIDSFLSLWALLLLLVGMLQVEDMTSRVLLPLFPLYLLSARLVAETLPLAKGASLNGRWLVSAVALAVPIAVAMVMLNRVSTPGTSTPVEYFYAEACLVAVAAVLMAVLPERRGQLALAWWAVAILFAGYLVHGAAFLNYRMETVSMEPLVGAQVSPILRDAATYESYISQYFQTRVTVDPELRTPLAWYLRAAKDVAYSTELTRGIGLSLLHGDAAPTDPGSDRRPGLYTPSIDSRELTWQGVWRWAVSRGGLVTPNQRDIIVRAPAGNW
jgi:hypothetical protein